MSDIFDVLSDDSRRTILQLLLTRSTSPTPELSVSNIVVATGLSQPSVSKQLKVLRDVGLVGVREDGQHRLYRLEAAPLRDAEAWLASFMSRGTGAATGAGATTGKTTATSTGAVGSKSQTATASSRTSAPQPVLLPPIVLDVARDLGAALADLAGKAPWR